MKTLKSVAALALSTLFLTGCGLAVDNADKNPVKTQQASSVISFAVPIRPQGSQFAEFQKTSDPNGIHANTVTPHPQFMDSEAFTSAGSALHLLLDGHELTAITFTSVAPGNGPSAAPMSTFDGGKISYSSTITSSEIDITVNLTTVTGTPHRFGVVQTNGACAVNASGTTDWCLGGRGAVSEGLVGTNLGYVLAEGQTQSFTLSTDSSQNNPISVTLGSVLEAGYICPTGPYANGCDNTPGTPDGNGWYHITAMPVDENGVTAIPQTAQANWAPYLTPYANGAWEITKTDPNGVIDLQPESSGGSLGPFTAPNPIQRPSTKYWDGQYAKFKCLQTGTATIAMRLYQGTQGASAVQVDGFTHNSSNYPATGALLGRVGSDAFYGNGQGITVSCTAYGSVAIVVN